MKVKSLVWFKQPDGTVQSVSTQEPLWGFLVLSGIIRKVSSSSYFCFSFWIIDCGRCKMIFPSDSLFIFFFLPIAWSCFQKEEGWCSWFSMQLHWSLKQSSLWPNIPGHPWARFFQWEYHWCLWFEIHSMTLGVVYSWSSRSVITWSADTGKYLCGNLKSLGSWWWRVGFWNTRPMEGKLVLPPGQARLWLAAVLLFRPKNHSNWKVAF